MSKDISELLNDKLRFDIEPSDAHLEQIIKLAQTAYAGRRKLRYISTVEMIASQLRFAARPIWLIQFIALLCLCVFLALAKLSEEFTTRLPAFISVCAVFASMTVLPVYGRSRRYKMRELESATRIFHPRLVLAKLCAVGVGDAVCLAAITLLSVGSMTYPAQTVLAFVLMPFLISCIASLFILNRVGEEYGVCVSTGVGVGIGMLCWTMAEKLQASVTQLPLGLVIAVCAAAVLILALECLRLTRQIPSTDLREALIF